MKKNFAKRMVAAAILTSWLITPAAVFAEGRVVNPSGNTIDTISGISNSDYSSGYRGGAIENNGIINSVIGDYTNNKIGTSDNAQQVNGGAIYNAGHMTINGANFNSNQAVSSNPKYSYGGAIYNDSNGDLTIGDNSSFSNNSAAYGGAVYNWSDATLKIGNNVTFDGNSVTGSGTGGAIHSRNGFDAGDNLVVQNNTTGSASYGGGGIYIGIDDSKSPQPTRTDVTIGNDAKFINNSTDTNRAGSRGGAILAEGAPGGITIGTGSEFRSNSAQAGGAIWNQAAITIGGNASFIGNNSTANAFGFSGGAIANIGNLTFNGTSLFQANNAQNGNGGALDNANTAVYKELASFNGNTASGNGGAVYNKGSLTFENGANFGQIIVDGNNKITGAQNGNTAGQNGGAIANVGGTVDFTAGGGIFAGNTANQGGAISNFGDGGLVNLGDNAVFAYNKANSVGGAISTVDTGAGKTVIGDNATFVGNQSAQQGGAVHNQRANTEIGNNAKFYNNTAIGYGGGAIYQDTDGTASSVKVGKNAEFVQNSSTTSHGGAIMNFNAANGADLTIDQGASFVQNTAGKTGGAVSNWGGNVSIGSNAEFTKNHAATNGGAIYNTTYGGSDGVLSIGGNTAFTGNIADELGGAVYNAGKMTFDTADGDITFTDNKAGGVANDIYMATDSSLTLKGANKVSIGGGISGDAVSTAEIINNGANLVLEQGSKNAGYLGNYTQNSGTTDVNSELFGGTSTISGGSLNLNDKADIVAGSKVILDNNSTIDINGSGTTQELQNSNVVINGAIESASAGKGSITLGGGHLVINGDQSGFTGKFDQNGDLDTTTTISSGAVFFGGDNKINSGKLIVEDGAKLASDVEITDYSVALSLGNREFLLSDGGIKIDGKDPNTQYSIFGSLNLEKTHVKVDETTGLQSDLYIANGSTITNNETTPGVEPGKTVVIGGGGNNVTLSLGSGASTGNEQKLQITNGSTINLTPNSGTGSLHLHAAIESAIEGDGTVLVEGTEMKAGAGKYDVGNILISSDNSNFTGQFIQNDGTVTLDKGAVLFGGTNNVNTDTTAGTSGSLILSDGALLANDVNINGNSSSSIFDLASVSFNGDAGEVTQNNITSGEFNYAAIDGASGNGVNVNNAAAVFQNNTIIKELDAAQNALVLTTNTTDNKGVRFLGFGQGSGVEGNVNLESGTGLGYLDGAYIKDDSTLTMNNADLVFGNNGTINYNPIIVGNGNISMAGDGITSISSALNSNINILAQSGVLNLNNKTTNGLGNVFVGDYENTSGADFDDSGAVVNVAASNATVGEIKVFGENARLNLWGNIAGTDATVKEGTLGVYGQSSLDSLSLGSSLDMMGNNAINNLNITNNFALTNNSNFSFDVDPRTLATDTINASNIINANADPAGDPYQMLVAGINFTRSPIDRNVQFDISNMIVENGDSRPDLIKMPDGGVISNSAMGQYLITSSGAGSPILNASLLALNPQMYRGQVATIASWQNQLVVNNMLFDHMDVLTRQLMNEQKTANKYAAAYPQFAPYQYDLKGGSLWYKAYGNFERLSMTRGLSVGNNAYGSLIGADFPLINLKNGWKLVPTAYIGYNGAHQTFNGVSMYQNGAQLGFMGTAYKGDFITSLLAYGGGYANDMSVKGGYGSGSDTTGNWFAGVASKSAYNIHLPHDLVFQPTLMVAYNAFGSQNWGSSFGAMSMNSGMLNGLNAAPGFNLIWQKKTFSLYATAQMVYNVMGQVDGRAGNVDLGYVRMRHSYFEYGLGAMKTFKDRFTGYLQITFRNGGRTGVGFQGGLQWKIGKE